MTIAVSVLLFLITTGWLVMAFWDGFNPISFLIAAAQGTLGVLQLAMPLQGILITNGVLLCIWGFVGIALTHMVLVERMVPLILMTILLSTAWVITFAVLQLTIVV
ncbi:MAG: hypothetical protein AAB554_02910 [Patescibacteria group bacterium]